MNTFKTNLEALGWDFDFIDDKNYFEFLNFIVSVNLTCMLFDKPLKLKKKPSLICGLSVKTLYFFHQNLNDMFFNG